MTDRYRAQQALQQSEERYRMLFTNNPMPMWMFDEGTLAFLDVNEAAIEAYGYAREEFLSMTLHDIRPPEEVDGLLADIGRRRPTRHTDGPWRHRKKDGSVIVVEITAVPITAFGRPAKFVSATDITARVQAEAELRRSEEQYRAIVETATDAIITIDENSRIVFASTPVETIFGHDPTSLIGQPLTNLMPQTLRAAHLAGFKKYLQTNQRQTSWKLLELVGCRKDGSEVPLELSIGEFRSGSGRWFTGVVRDVSDRRRARDMLQESKEQIKTVVETVPLAVSELDLLGRVVFWNRAAEKMFQWTEVEVRDRELPIIPEDEHQDFKHLLSELAGGRQLNGLERKGRRKDGKVITCAIWTASLHSAGGSIRGTVAVIADVTERKLAEEQTRKHLRELAAYERQLEEFAWAAAHRLEEPARFALSRADEAQQHWSSVLPSEGQADLGEVRTAAWQMHAHVQGLRMYWDVQHKALATHTIGLQSIVDAALDTLASKLADNAARVTYGTLPNISGDRQLLTQLFIQLLDNALKFRYLRSPEIHISAEGLEESWILRIKDNGIGMDSRDFDRAFHLFEKLSRQQPGLGLGLSLVRQIMQRHEGSVSITSEPRGGTTVYLTFKRCPETTAQSEPQSSADQRR